MARSSRQSQAELGASLTSSTRGLMGISALIIFIAIILIAAIAASVLITSGSGLQQKAFTTGSQAKDGVNPGFEPLRVLGTDPTDASTPHQISKIEIVGRLPAGADPLNFNSTVINVDTPEFSASYTYGGIVAATTTASGTSDFVITYIKSGPQSVNDYMTTGDMMSVKFNLRENLRENMKGKVTILPVKGNMNQIEFIAPDSLVDPTEQLWPIS